MASTKTEIGIPVEISRTVPDIAMGDRRVPQSPIENVRLGDFYLIEFIPITKRIRLRAWPFIALTIKQDADCVFTAEDESVDCFGFGETEEEAVQMAKSIIASHWYAVNHSNEEELSKGMVRLKRKFERRFKPESYS